MKNIYRLFYTFAIIIIVFFILTVALTITLNTSWGKNKLLSTVTIFSKEKAVDISFDGLRGFLPFQVTLSNVKLIIDENKSITIEKLSFRPSYSKLLKRTLSFKQLTATNTLLVGFEQKASSLDIDLLDQLSFAIQIKSFKLNNIRIKGSQVAFNIKGKLRIEKDFDYISINSQVSRVLFPNSYANFKIRAGKNRFFKLDLSSKINDVDSLKPYLDIPVRNNLTLETKLSSSWESFIGLALPTNQNLPDIKGSFSLFIDGLKNFESSLVNNLEISGNINLNPNRTVKLEKVLVFNDYLDAKGFFVFNSFSSLQKANLFFDIYSFSEIKNLKLSSPLKVNIDIEKKGADYSFLVNGDINSFLLDDIAILNSNFTFNGQLVDKKLQGKCAYTSTFQQRNLLFNSDVNQKDNSLSFSNLQFKSDFFNVDGNLNFYTKNNILGDLNLSILDLSMLEIVFPNLFIDGSLKANIHIDTNQNNFLDISMHVNDVEYNKIGTSNGTLNLLIKEPFETPTFDISASLGVSKFFNTTFQSIKFSTSTDQENWPINIVTVGEEIDANATGFWHFDEKNLNLNIQDLFGTLYNQSFFLVEPLNISWIKDQEFQISEFTLSMEAGFLSSNVFLSPDSGSFKLAAENFPIDLISLNTLELSIQGSITGNMKIEHLKGNTDGQFSFLTKNTKLYNPDDSEELIGSGKLEGNIKKNTLEIESNFQSNKKVLLNSFLSLGIQFNPFPLKIAFLNQAPLSGRVTYDARAEDLLDFIDLGFNFVRGDLNCDLKLSGTLIEPNIIGECTLKNGTYENYLAGVYLKHINAKIIGRQNKLEIVELSANGIKDGDLTATGELILNYKEHFPYFIDADLDRIQIVKLDFFEGKLQGKAYLEGNTKQATLTGDATIKEAEFSIPERFKSKVPTLPVTYINVPEDFKSPVKKDKFLFYLDVYLNAPKNIFVRGRGLSGELKGEIKLEGTINNLITKGRLDLIKGDFLFSGHNFDLTKGEFVFGEEGALPFLFLSAQTTIQGVTINATLSGQLDSPTLEFKSLPPMPLSSILSYLLFGSDISEISALQAVTLASTAGSLAGGGTDILEATRRTLGVDRLAVVSSPGSVGDEDFAVQIGKYVAKGVLVSFSQGVEQGSANIIVEVDLKHGFIFSAETVQQEEQGRFSLKWNRNF